MRDRRSLTARHLFATELASGHCEALRVDAAQPFRGVFCSWAPARGRVSSGGRGRGLHEPSSKKIEGSLPIWIIRWVRGGNAVYRSRVTGVALSSSPVACRLSPAAFEPQ